MAKEIGLTPKEEQEIENLLNAALENKLLKGTFNPDGISYLRKAITDDYIRNKRLRGAKKGRSNPEQNQKIKTWEELMSHRQRNIRGGLSGRDWEKNRERIFRLLRGRKGKLSSPKKKAKRSVGIKRRRVVG